MAYNLSLSLTLEYLSREKLPTVLPTVICVGILMVIGLVGNIFVVIVFGCLLKKQSTYRHFILVLAVYDLTACSLGMPALIYEMVKAYMFDSGIGCRFLRYGYHMIAGGSSMTHALVGIDRYRRICRPAHTQMSVQTAKTVSILTLIFCLICTSPVFIMSDTVDVETRVANITGRECGISPEYSKTALPILFNSLLSFYLLATFVLLVVLYSMIGYTLCRRRNIIKPFQGHSEHDKNTSFKVTKPRQGKHRDKFQSRIRMSARSSDQESVSQTPTNLATEAASRTMDRTTSRPKETNVSTQSRKFHARETVSRKMTVITFVITMVFILSFAPIQVLALMAILNEDIQSGMTYTNEVLYRFGNHTYVINNIANPLVYIFMDIMFRQQCLKILQMLKCKLFFQLKT